MSSNRDVVRAAFDAWAAGTAYITDIFAPEMQWEIVGRSAASGSYGSAQEFIEKVLHPFGARFSAGAPFRPVNVRGIYEDEGQSTVAIVWDGEGTTTAGPAYRNTYAWFMTFERGKVVKGTAFYDSIAFNELWESVVPG